MIFSAGIWVTEYSITRCTQPYGAIGPAALVPQCQS